MPVRIRARHTAKRKQRQQVWGARILGSIAAVGMVLAGFLLVPSLFEQERVGVVVSTATPTPSVSATPTLTPTPSTPSPSTWMDWKFEGATLTVPKTCFDSSKPAICIDGAPIHELRPDELVTKTYVDAAGNSASYEALEPADIHGITWDTTVKDGMRYPKGSVLSGLAESTVYLYCHDYRDETALCSIVYDVSALGDAVTLETATEVLTYVVQERFNALKAEIPNDPRVVENAPGRLVLITCYSSGDRDTGGDTLYNSVIVFQLESSVMK